MRKNSINRKLGCATIYTFVSVILLIPYWASSFTYAASFDSPNEIALFANHLMQDGDYRRATGEFRRYLKMNISTREIRSTHEKIITCLAREKENTDIQKELEYLYRNRKKLGLTSDFWCRIAQVLEKEKDYANAAIAYQICSNTTLDPKISRCASLYQVKMLILSGQNSRASNVLDTLRNKQNNVETYQLMIMALTHNRASKSPKLAMFLSALLPGSGHIYAGNHLHGVSSFLINLGLVSAAYFSFKHDSPVLGSFVTYLETGFYLGGIKTAGRDARKTNARNKKILRNRLLRILTSDTEISLGKRSGNFQFVYRF